MLDAFVFANLRDAMQVTFNAALHVGRVLERGAKFLLLLDAVRAPIRPVHLRAPISQAAREGIMLVLAPMVQIVRKSKTRLRSALRKSQFDPNPDPKY